MNNGDPVKILTGVNNLEFLKQFPSSKETLRLSTGELVEINKYFLSFKPWTGGPIRNTYGNKMVLDWNGEPVFAELAVLKLFRSHGWEGVWVDSYRRKYRIGLPEVVEPVELPRAKKGTIDTLRQKTGKFGGCWDVFAWKDSDIIFAELKRKKKDNIQQTQITWLEKSLEIGLSKDNFFFVEWEVE